MFFSLISGLFNIVFYQFDRNLILSSQGRRLYPSNQKNGIMKATIQKKIILSYLFLGGLLASIVHLVGISKSRSENAVERFSNSIGQLILEAYAVHLFGLFVIASSIVGWWINQRKAQPQYVKTFQLTLAMGVVYYSILFACGYISF